MDNQKVITSDITDRVVTVEKLLEIYNIDLEIWEIEKQIVNTWEVGAKGPDGKITTTPLFQVKLWLKRKQVLFELQNVRQEFLEDLKRPNATLIDSHEAAPLIKRDPLLFWQSLSGILALICMGLVVKDFL